ncbi:MAG: efflux RND transporter periplasmic adaptor subunit [Gemmatimonadetes bacterium]|nr:efflux RND transporter periplasmic adaptor subunit [Gemmatimonadota bacterium]
MTRATLLLLLFAAACSRHADEPASPAAEVTATVEQARLEVFHELVDALGTVAPRAGHVAVLAAPAPTRVSRVFVVAGAAVAVGDALVEFEQAPFEAAAASANAALAAAERAAARAIRLAEAGVLPRKDADAAATELAVARVNAVNARRARELSTLRAPIAGTVTRMNAVLGASADPAQPLVEVADLRALDVVLTTSPTDAARVQVGQLVQLYPGSGEAAAPVALGEVAGVASMVDSASGGVAVRVAVVSTIRPLRIAEALSGRIAVAMHSRAVMVPLDALVPAGEGFKVFVVDAAGVAHGAAVKIGGRSAGGAWVTEGVKAGDRVVTKGAYGMDDSTRVVSGKP